MRLESRLTGAGLSVWLDELRSLLAGIEETGSLNQAASGAGIGYRRAWQIIRDASEITGAPLVESATGGHAGGGSRLTDHGRTVLGAISRSTPRSSLLATFHTSVTSLPAGPLLIASSTVPVDSGLLSALCDAFSSEHGTRTAVLSVGSGAALRMAADGRVDCALTHAPDLEHQLAAAGLLAHPVPVMKSAYVLLCGDPDAVPPAGETSAASLFHWIAGHEYQFISRADQSGTHLREQELWRLVDQPTDRPWYRRLGGTGASGGGTATAIAEVRCRSAFTIADRLAVGEQAGVRIVQLDGREAENQFSLVTPADPAPGRHHALAFLSWITSESARTIIRRFGAEPSA